jgi:hypothetical protein
MYLGIKYEFEHHLNFLQLLNTKKFKLFSLSGKSFFIYKIFLKKYLWIPQIILNKFYKVCMGLNLFPDLI